LNAKDNKGDTVTKAEFAALVRVSPGRVSQWLKSGQLSGAALVGRGHRARIRVAEAMAQLRRKLDPVQHLGAAGRAKLNGDGGEDEDDTVEAEIKRARLAHLALSNAKAAAEEAARSGRYELAAGAKQEMGRITARLMATFESSFTEFANAIMAAPPATARDAVRTLRSTWRTIRMRQAKAVGDEAAALPPLLDDEAHDADSKPATTGA